MKLNHKILLTCFVIAIVTGAIFSVYSQAPLYLSAQDPAGNPTQIDLTQDPTGTQWHEIYPTYSIVRVITHWIDNGGPGLDPSDQVEFDNTGVYYHVDQVLTTIHWTWKENYPADPTPTVESASETDWIDYPLEGVSPDPTVDWHQIYPPDDFSRTFKITSHEDTNGDGAINPSEQFDMTYDDNAEVRWAHLDAISTDIVVSPKEPVPEFPLGVTLVLGLGLAVAIIYVAWKRRPISPKKI